MIVSQLLAAGRRLISDDKGVTALEYGVIAAAIVIALSLILPGVGAALTATFTAITAAL